MIFGLFAFWKDRERCPPFVLKFFAWMMAESAAWAVVAGFGLAVAVNQLLQVMPNAIPSYAMLGLPEASFTMKFALSLGAGLYEELFFRVLLVGGLAICTLRLQFLRCRAR